jgi:hypothetical protein
MRKQYSKSFYLQVTEAGKTVKKTFEVDKSVVVITAIALNANREELLYYRGTFRLEINKDEIFNEETSAKKIYALPSVDANNRSYRIGMISTGNGLITFEYTDNEDGRTLFTPYTVSLTIDGERESNA